MKPQIRTIRVYCPHGDDKQQPIADMYLFLLASQPQRGWTLQFVLDVSVPCPVAPMSPLAELSGDRRLPEHVDTAALEALASSGRYRNRYRFSCPTCPETLPARDERLEACAALLVGQSVSQVSMPTLRRMLELV